VSVVSLWWIVFYHAIEHREVDPLPPFTRWLATLSRGLNALAGAAVAAMMLLTCADIVLRLLRRPLTGTYELVGFCGALAVSFALAQTSIDRGHIAVDFLVQRFPPRVRAVVEAVNSLVAAALFGLVAWQAVGYAASLRRAGEVSMTLQLPVYPIAYGIALGCGVLCLVLLSRTVESLGRILPSPDDRRAAVTESVRP